MSPAPTVADLVAAAVEGDRRGVARLISVLERAGPAADEIAELTGRLGRGGHVVGVTGAPGSGKSTLVAALVGELVARGARPAVIAVDPSSPRSGGAILGDRIRMAGIEGEAFVRSVATRGHAGGLALVVPGALRVLDAAGYSPLVVETVGTGQVEVDVAAVADTTVVVVAPDTGDAVQASKAGLLEVGDVFVVSKADRARASTTRRDLTGMLDIGRAAGEDGRRPPVVVTSARQGTGVRELADAVDEHLAWLGVTGAREARRTGRAAYEVLGRVRALAAADLAAVAGLPQVEELAAQVAVGRRSPDDAARLVRRWMAPPGT